MREDKVVESEPEWFSNPTKIIQTTLDGRWIFNNLEPIQQKLSGTNVSKGGNSQ